MEAPWSSCDRVSAATAARKAPGYRMALGRFPRASWRASDRSERITSFIVAPPRDGATMPRPGGYRPDGEPRGLTILLGVADVDAAVLEHSGESVECKRHKLPFSAGPAPPSRTGTGRRTAP